jgi:Spy/CpxP family protein refolding chaperone
MKQPNLKLRHLAAILTLAVTPALAPLPSYAMPPMGGPGEHTTQALEQLHAKLTLTPDQEKLWKQAEESTKALSSERRTRFRAKHDELKAALSDPNSDLHAVANKMDADLRAELDKARDNRNQWLAFYDSLKPEQRQTVRSFLLEKLEHPKGPRHGQRKPGGTPESRP